MLFVDLLSFDTKYKTNRYGMVFALLTGINHHLQLTCFGAGLIWDNKEESFKWLFQCFIDAMGGNKPKAIITDQDLAISKGYSLCLRGAPIGTVCGIL